MTFIFSLLNNDAALIEQGLLLHAKGAIEMPDGILRDMELDRFHQSARRYKVDGLKILHKALDEKFKAIESPVKPPTQQLKEATAKYVCPNCKRNFSSQQALKGHRPLKCNGT